MGASVVYGVLCILMPLVTWCAFQIQFQFYIPILGIVYKGWRLYMVICSLPGLLVALILIVLPGVLIKQSHFYYIILISSLSSNNFHFSSTCRKSKVRSSTRWFGRSIRNSANSSSHKRWKAYITWTIWHTRRHRIDWKSKADSRNYAGPFRTVQIDLDTDGSPF